MLGFLYLRYSMDLDIFHCVIVKQVKMFYTNHTVSVLRRNLYHEILALPIFVICAYTISLWPGEYPAGSCHN